VVQLAIRLHPCVPVAVPELEGWLELEVDELRSVAPRGTVRLSRLTQRGPTADLDVGWLLELELAEGEPLLAGERLADALRDMRLLGLEPRLLLPSDIATDGRPGPPGVARAHREGQVRCAGKDSSIEDAKSA
jgi:hypothetical protein